MKPHTHSLEKIRIVALDDDPCTLEMIQEVLMLEGANVKTFIREQEFMRYISMHPLDVILLDVVLPDSDGWDLFCQLREFPLHMHTPVLFLTGAITPEQAPFCNAGGGHCRVLAKPFSFVNLVAEVNRMAGVREAVV